jgi:serine/threonine-protein kinase
MDDPLIPNTRVACREVEREREPSRNRAVALQQERTRGLRTAIFGHFLNVRHAPTADRAARFRPECCYTWGGMGRSASDENLGEGGTRFGDPVEVAATTAQAHAQTHPPLAAGSVIDGKYRLDKILGEGGMGSVWQALNLQLDIPVAVKLLRAGPDLASLSERMKLEARSAARLVHPAIVRVFDIDATANGDPFIVMELLRGESLADLLDRGRLSTVHAVQTLLPICEALALAHAKSIVHRDLKPQNVFMSEESERLQPKLLDFGIAKLVDASLPAGSITDTGIMLGSPDYMSPEQARGLTDLDHRTDIWSFCVVLYEAVTGITPFQGVNYNALMRAIIDEPPLPIPAEIVVEPRLRDIIFRGLSKDRAQRPSSIQALGRELAQWLKSRGVHEDVTGGTLETKWTGRAPQRSVPVITDEAVASLSAQPVLSDATLVSVSHPEPHERESEALIVDARAGRRPRWWGLVAGSVALSGALAWTLASVGSSTEPRAIQGSSSEALRLPAPSASLYQQPAPAAVATAPVQLAITPPSPSINPVTSSMPHARKATPRPAKPATPSQSATPKTPARDGRDDDHELLQAY